MAAAGAAHVATEITFSEAVAFRVSAGVALVVIAYLVRRVRRLPNILRAWGMRRDNFRECLWPHLAFAAVGLPALVALGAALDPLALPPTFWLVLGLYPLWGIAQQFALQNLLARNVAALVPNRFAIATTAAVLFAAAHYPRLDLVGLTLVSGFAFTLLYLRWPNLWAVGISHGILGTVAAYLVVREDPGALILDSLLGR